MHLKIDLRPREPVISADKLTAPCQARVGDYRGFPCELYFTNFLDYRHEKPLKWPSIRLTSEGSGSAQKAMNYPASPASRSTSNDFPRLSRRDPGNNSNYSDEIPANALKRNPPPSNRPRVTGAIHLPEISRVLNTGLGCLSRKKRNTIIEIFLFLLIRRPIHLKEFITFFFKALDSLRNLFGEQRTHPREKLNYQNIRISNFFY